MLVQLNFLKLLCQFCNLANLRELKIFIFKSMWKILQVDIKSFKFIFKYSKKTNILFQGSLKFFDPREKIDNENLWNL